MSMRAGCSGCPGPIWCRRQAGCVMNATGMGRLLLR